MLLASIVIARYILIVLSFCNCIAVATIILDVVIVLQSLFVCCCSSILMNILTICIVTVDA